uniref:Uncharacterized protein n=1 Tax=Rhizophora mucronata TaxID=61149 RepID=A0A2P2J4M2_RHIMU
MLNSSISLLKVKVKAPLESYGFFVSASRLPEEYDDGVGSFASSHFGALRLLFQ